MVIIFLSTLSAIDQKKTDLSQAVLQELCNSDSTFLFCPSMETGENNDEQYSSLRRTQKTDS